jgi:hypothetical protein
LAVRELGPEDIEEIDQTLSAAQDCAVEKVPLQRRLPLRLATAAAAF